MFLKQLEKLNPELIQYALNCIIRAEFYLIRMSLIWI